MRIPGWGLAPIYLMSTVELGGFLVGALRWSRLSHGQKAITLWFGAAITVDLLDLGLAPIFKNAQPIENLLLPLSAVLIFEAFASYQVTHADKIRFRLIGASYAVIWAVLHLSVEWFDLYSTYSAPLHGVVVLAGASVVVFQRVLRGRNDVMVDPAFLVAAGLCGVAIAAVFKTLIAELWFHDNPTNVLIYYSACNMLTALAELIMVRALLVPSGRATQPAN